MADELIEDKYIEEDMSPESMEAPPEEGFEMEEPESVAGTALQFTTDELPELADLNIGDTFEFEISNISEDGIYELKAIPVAPIVEEELEEELPGAGQEDVAAALVS